MKESLAIQLKKWHSIETIAVAANISRRPRIMLLLIACFPLFAIRECPLVMSETIFSGGSGLLLPIRYWWAPSSFFVRAPIHYATALTVEEFDSA
jgi:hypothetical protein